MEEANVMLDEWAQRARTSSSKLRKAATGAVVEWKWSNAWLWSPVPYWFERGEYPRGKLQDAPSTPEQGQFCTGFDKDGRVRVERVYSDIVREGERWYDETVYEHSAGRVGWAKYRHSGDGQPISGGIAQLNDRKVRTIGYFGRDRHWFEQYDWSNPRLLQVTREDVDRLEEVEFDTAGEIIEARTVDAGSAPWIRWRRAGKGQTVENLGKVVCNALRKAIPECASRLNLQEPAYCLLVTYDNEGNDLFLPVLGVGLESERERWKREDPEDWNAMIWSPAEFANFAGGDLTPDLPELADEVRMLNQLILHEGRCAEGIQLIRDVARDLGKLDWSSRLNVTEDFVISAVGTEAVSLEDDLSDAVGNERFESLRQQNMIP